MTDPSGTKTKDEISLSTVANGRRIIEVTDLTANSVFRIEATGILGLDVAGSTSPVLESVALRNVVPGSNVMGWDLKVGTYDLLINESVVVPVGGLAIVQPHQSLLDQGAFHPTVVLDHTVRELHFPIQISQCGLRLVEGATVTRAVLLG